MGRRRTESKRSRRRRTLRKMKGGIRQDIVDIMNSIEIKPNLTINPNSNFVVATYWWGTGNTNRNTQLPCYDDTIQAIKLQLRRELEEEDTDYQELRAQYNVVDIEYENNPTPETRARLRDEDSKLKAYLDQYYAKDNIKNVIATRYEAEIAKIKASGRYRERITFDEMIAIWETQCRKIGVNYVATMYPFDRSQYQEGINGKPLFIKKCLEVCQGKAVVYIDGDMFINKYPYLFEIKNVDYMGQGWNIDPRSSSDYKTIACFDPYIFETSGGTMYFANSPMSHRLLDEWIEAASLPESQQKADDRVLSMMFMQRGFIMRTSLIQLPIEYLWLTNKYLEFHSGEDADVCDSIIEHPACLTSEEGAKEQGAASDRSPEGYREVVNEQTFCDRHGGKFYEFIYFDDERMAGTFGPFLKYLRHAKNVTTGQPLFSVIPFSEKYGEFNEIANRNLTAATGIQVQTPTQQSLVNLPLDAPIPEILARLSRGFDVQLGDDETPLEDATDIRCVNLAEPRGMYVTDIQIDIESPIYLSHTNTTVTHLLTMCETLADINKHLQQSYVFASRIRWVFV
jgi:hypothetical protein